MVFMLEIDYNFNYTFAYFDIFMFWGWSHVSEIK